MVHQPLTAVDIVIRRARRRLFLQTLLNRLAWCCVGALVATAAWLLLYPFLLGKLDVWLRLTVAGGALGIASVVAVLLAWWQAPSSLAAALALDDRFTLKERVTTALSLSPREASTPAGQALLADVNQRVQPLKVAERFPVRLSWSTALVPVCAAVLAVIAVFYEPALGTATTGTGKDAKNAVANAPEIQKQLELLKKAPRTWAKDQDKSEKFKEIEAAWDKLVNQPLDPNNQEKVRERVQAMRDLEEKMKERADNLKSRQALKQQLGKLQQDQRDGKANAKDGPAKALQDALAKGDMAKAKEEVERLMKKVAQDKMTPEEQKKLEDQLDDLKNKLERLADQKDRKEQLKRDREDGKIDQDQLEREMNDLANDSQDLQELDGLAKQLEACRACLRGGDRKGAAEKLGRLLEQLEQLELTEQELRQLRDAQADLEEARLGMCQCLNGQCDMEGKKNGLGKGRRPGTLRPIAPDAPTENFDARQRADVDPTGKQRITGFTRGGAFTKIPAREVGGVFRQAVQDAPDAIERQRVPPEAAEMLKGYYENLGGQKKN
jgi:hypothetical protein